MSGAAANDAPLLDMRGVTKRFGGLVALSDVDFSVRAGEVMAVVGDNGAGKSTLIKTMSGAYQPDEGEIRFAGESVRFRSPQDAWASGIATIYQELALAGKMNVAENIFLGRELKRPRFGIPFLDRRAMRERTRKLLGELDVHVPNIDAWVETMSGGQRQGIAIARALNMDARLIIMDEPTAALAVAEVRKVLDFVRALKGSGKAVVLISHNINDVFAVSDRISVMRHGRRTAVRETATCDPEEIIGFITGAREVRPAAAGGSRPPADTQPKESIA